MQIDSNLSKDKAIEAKPGSRCPEAVLSDQVLVDVKYYNFEGTECSGQIVIASRHMSDIKELFRYIHRTRFPLAKVIPIADPKYTFDDITSCDDNNSSAFNYRIIAGTDRLSNHALGNAFDLNPLQNPFIRYDTDGKVVCIEPKNAMYDEKAPGALHGTHGIVVLLKRLGWSWGGDWKISEGRIDYQHFEKSSILDNFFSRI